MMTNMITEYAERTNIARLRRVFHSQWDDACRDFNVLFNSFQSYQDDVRVTMKGCVQCNSVYGWEDFASRRDSNPRRLGQ